MHNEHYRWCTHDEEGGTCVCTKYKINYPLSSSLVFSGTPGTVHTSTVQLSHDLLHLFILFDPGFVRMCATENPILRFL